MLLPLLNEPLLCELLLPLLNEPLLCELLLPLLNEPLLCELLLLKELLLWLLLLRLGFSPKDLPLPEWLLPL